MWIKVEATGLGVIGVNTDRVAYVIPAMDHAKPVIGHSVIVCPGSLNMQVKGTVKDLYSQMSGSLVES